MSRSVRRSTRVNGASDLAPLLELIRRLRSEDGCPWDREQSLSTVRSYLVEEAHEVAAALDLHREAGGAALREELGDLLFQCCFIGVLAEEAGLFALADSLDEVHGKMVARHPHVFSEDRLETAEQVAAAWEKRKQKDPARTSVLDGVPRSMPALARAHRVGQKVAAVGFDWPDISGVLAKVGEELAEVADALELDDPVAVEDEIGDLLLSVASLARHAGIDPDQALARANHKFESRFQILERNLPHDAEADIDELEELWQRAKLGQTSET